VLDATYAELERGNDGLVRVRAGDTTVWADASYAYFQLFTGDLLPDVARRSLAIEPMTCPPNAFRTGEGLICLAPGERFEGRWGIETGSRS
jgi:aldose 1-epimerase